MGFSGSGTFIVFFKGHIGDDDAVHAGFLAAGKEFFSAVMEYGIEIGQKDQGNLRFLADPFDQGKDVVNARPCFQSPQVRFLDDDAFGDGIGKGDADFDEVCSGLFHGHDIFIRLVQRRVRRLSRIR